MEIIARPELAADPEPTFIEIAKNQPEYRTLPALVYQDGKVLTEWRFTEEERAAIARGEDLRLWVWAHPQVCRACGVVQPAKLQPIALEVTSEHTS